ncbi:MAG: HAMP domain-containing histidine kinase [Candidatus Brocadia sp. AMX2]|uniref:histidine kinase n=1 Tax=Candidatus Brocadia sinica JPN1 TaxID=1197129 RepID=A0ABQ0JZ18_9BACT|nr:MULTISPECIES: HAMP domain-containing histidine kinase [Brocadia]KXK27944.1 MAG: two-component sensor kinase [Candidatus Brocadia sinica]MBC6932227.1 HAMP domain-containing histidine kinase [Candidatus Brocadia sp.]MBL1168499.1 HAMP domain-containing histidine kinase [Candidatus Brocadia sp. AMX1]NOG40216.1 HAMP domain-containing histidine kinase [Planctomycetota bacterium]KAA0243667.1 MAG: HAMP domain-containing histidine kinase [Candidatus Brocadia sp. AMX2]
MNIILKEVLQKYLSRKNFFPTIFSKFHIPPYKSIKTKIIISSILLSVFPIFIMRVFIYPTEKKALQDALIQNLEGVGHKQAELIVRWIEERKADARIVAENPNVPGVIYKSEGSENFYRLLHHLNTLREAYGYKEIFICDRFGDLKITTSTGKVITNLAGFEFFQMAISGVTFVSPIMPSVIPLENEYGKLEHGLPTLYISTPVVYEHKVIGAVCLRVGVMEISKLMRSVRLGETGETYLINKDGYMISESKYLKYLKDAGFVQQRTTLELQVLDPRTKELTRSAEECIKGKKGHDAEGYTDYRGIKVLGFWQWIPELDWGIIAEIDVNEGYGPVERLHTIVAPIIILVTLAVISFAFFFGKKISDPILYLTEVTKSISEGDYSKRVKITSNDEIGELSNSFNKMASFLEEKTQILKEYTANLERTVEERTKDLTRMNQELEKQSSNLEKAYKELLTLDQMKDKMIRDVSHELKSPVAQVQMAIDLWSMEVKKAHIDRSKEEKFGKIISNSLQRLRKTIGNILDLSVLESGRLVFKKESIQMDELVLQITAGMRLLTEKKGLALINHVNQGLPAVIGDKDEIQRVVTNLIDNAIKYTEKGEIHVFLEQRDAFIEFAVKDTGIGIGLPRDMFGKLFERFFQERPRTDGAGVGLAICKNIVEAHKGNLWAESEGTGKGATFKFTLPIA